MLVRWSSTLWKPFKLGCLATVSYVVQLFPCFFKIKNREEKLEFSAPISRLGQLLALVQLSPFYVQPNAPPLIKGVHNFQVQPNLIDRRKLS